MNESREPKQSGASVHYLRAVGCDTDPTVDAARRDDRYDPVDAQPPCLFDELIARVGDEDSLAGLDAVALPNERFDWSTVEAADRPFVEQVLELSDRYCDEMLDVEFRTIARRILARVAARDPRVFRRSANARRFAGGLVYLAGRASGEFGRRGRRTSHGLWAWFGVGSCADRARGLRRAAGLEPDYTSDVLQHRDEWSLGDAALLHSASRARLCMRRDLLVSMKPRHTWTMLPDGRRAQVEAAPVKAVATAKGLVGTRAMLLVGLGEELEDASFFALTIPDAHDLARMLRSALDTPAPCIQPQTNSARSEGLEPPTF